METTFWEESQLSAPVKFENHIPYSATPNSEDEEYSFHGKKKMSRDPLSHRIIEKRRRDRMNSCLADLSRLIPHEYIKKGRGRVEKTEIIEMAIRRIKHLMGHAPCKESECHKEEDKKDDVMKNHTEPVKNAAETAQTPLLEHLASSYRLGFAECLNETVHFLVQVEGMMASDPFCAQLRSHLTRHCDHILQSESLRSRLCIVKEETSVPTTSENDSPQNDTTNVNLTGDNNDEKNSLESHCHQGQYQHQVHQGGTTHMYYSGQGGNQHSSQHQQQDSSSEASTTTGHLSTISNNHSPTSTNSEKTNLGDTDKATLPTYKFKNRIQKRFERGSSSSPAMNGSSASGNNLDENCANEGNRVPIFVLAPRGNYYLPMSLDYAHLPASYQDRSYAEQNDCILLHPVTISVDFRSYLDTLDRG